jgi:glycosyltransferase involved in cell wall biosynthesis
MISKISIITPVYNGEKFVESCLINIIEQNCNEVEHIIVDGGSKDRTVDIIKDYAGKYPHIRWISEKDKGQSDAMNKGIALAEGEILAILNVDDYYEPGVLRRAADLFKDLPDPTFLAGNCNVWDDDMRLMFVCKPSKLNIFDLLMGPNVNIFPVNPSSYFYHKSIHEKVGLYDVADHYCMDLDFILRAVQVANLRYMDELWGNFRLILGTKTRTLMDSKEIDLRSEVVLSRYRNNLPLYKKIYFKLKRRYLFSKYLRPFINSIVEAKKASVFLLIVQIVTTALVSYEH